MSADTFVYVLKSIDPSDDPDDVLRRAYVKVGISRHPRKRAHQIQAAMPILLGFHWASAPLSPSEARRVEAAAHHILASSHVRSEWFETRPNEAVWAVQQAARIRNAEYCGDVLDLLADEFAARDAEARK